MAAPTACVHCAAPAAPSLCGGCRFARYCGAACQRAAWPAHKPVCKAIAADTAGPFDGDLVIKAACDCCSAAFVTQLVDRCDGCRFAAYCGVACQRAHWPTHQIVCKAVGAAKFDRALAGALAGNVQPKRFMELYNSLGMGQAAMCEAVLHYRCAAEAGDTGAQHALGYCYEHGTGVEEDARAAVEWYKRAAEAGNVYAQAHLGDCYERGIGTTKNVRKALSWYDLVRASPNTDLHGYANAICIIIRTLPKE